MSGQGPSERGANHGRPPRPEAEYRATLTDDEFWAHVFPQGDPDHYVEDDDRPTLYGRACEVCGEHGPCGYDAEGRPMIHTEDEPRCLSAVPALGRGGERPVPSSW